jgi:hypothetical protein
MLGTVLEVQLEAFDVIERRDGERGREGGKLGVYIPLQ